MRPWVQSARASQATGATRTWIRAPGTMRAAISMHCFARGTLTCVRWQISDCGNINVERFSTRPRHTRRRGARIRGRTGNRRSPPPWSPCQISICPRQPTSRRRASASSPRRTACATDSLTTTWLRRRCCMRNARAKPLRTLCGVFTPQSGSQISAEDCVLSPPCPFGQGARDRLLTAGGFPPRSRCSARCLSQQRPGGASRRATRLVLLLTLRLVVRLLVMIVRVRLLGLRLVRRVPVRGGSAC